MICERCPVETDRLPVQIQFPDGLGRPFTVCAVCERAIRDYLADHYGYRLVPAPRPARQGLPLLHLLGRPGRRDEVGDRLEGLRHPDSEAGVGQPASLSELELRYAWGDR